MRDHAGAQGQTADQLVESDPLCFVLMPFGRKSDGTGTSVDFDAVYEELIAPAIRAAGLQPIRADEEMTGGIVHKPMFERLILCEYAVADLTFANANVFYELGVRHAVRPYSTVLIFASGTRLPFDVELDRGLPYALDQAGAPTDVEEARRRLADRLVAARDASVDSPVFQLVQGFPEIDRLKTDVFREQVRYSVTWKERLSRARQEGLEAVRQAERGLGDLRDVEAGILIDLFLSYRAVKGYEEMVALAERLPRPLAKTPLVREQLGLALNRLGRRDEAEGVLLQLIQERGPSSETYGILGRVYKDQWNDANEAGEEFLAEGLLEKAINAYLAGFEADWRDAYPGINAITLMEIHEPPDPRREQLIPVVAYAAERRLASDQADYWDHATRLELAVLAKDEPAAKRELARALAMVREQWEPESTANNLKLIREAREDRGDEVPWAATIERELLRKAGQPAAGAGGYPASP
jgi:tetratricopeptide (TPR) repeat protein